MLVGSADLPHEVLLIDVDRARWKTADERTGDVWVQFRRGHARHSVPRETVTDFAILHGGRILCAHVLVCANYRVLFHAVESNARML